MPPSKNYSRRSALKIIALSATSAVLTTGRSHANDMPLLNEDDPAAKAVHYVSDAVRAKDAKPGSKCGNCSLYAGDSKSTQASCAIFSSKQVLASGWCTAWTDI